MTGEDGRAAAPGKLPAEETELSRGSTRVTSSSRTTRRPAAGGDPVPATGPRPTGLVGALGGAATVFGFAFVHDLFISDIWFNLVPMIAAGAACGLSIVWSYRSAVGRHSTRLWLAYNAACAALLVALGAASFLVLDPRFTMAEMMVSDDALAQLIPPALPLMIAAALVGTVVIVLAFGRRGRAFVPTLTTQILLVFLVGHNLAILGLVESTSDLVGIVWEFVALTVVLAAVYAGSVLLLARLRFQSASSV